MIKENMYVLLCLLIAMLCFGFGYELGRDNYECEFIEEPCYVHLEANKNITHDKLGSLGILIYPDSAKCSSEYPLEIEVIEDESN